MLGSRQLLPRSRSSSPQGSPVRSGSASLLLSLLRPGHQPWACGCTPWRARDCRVPGGRGLTHLRARAAQWEGRGGGFGRSGRGRAAGLAPPPGARDVRAPLGACAGPGARLCACSHLRVSWTSPSFPASPLWLRISLPKLLDFLIFFHEMGILKSVMEMFA